ncbi:fidgetin-like isoform X2 [Denticeps clupeoides]|nr:fidgetin-like isoform X2 [Denticeps clupeoides]
MQWTPEHAQWAEQHFDITSTTRSPSHKAEAFRMQRAGSTSMATAAVAGYHYSWANDDISALTASNLLKKYAEKYSGILEVPGERVLISTYADMPTGTSIPAGPQSGRKSEGDPWVEGGVFPVGCEVAVPGKVGMAVSDVSVSLCSSPGVGSSASMAEQSFSSSSCASQALASQEYPASSAVAYNGSYLHAGYSGHPSPLLQPPPPSHPATCATLVPSAYSTTNSPSSLPGYSYPPVSYSAHHQNAAPGYSPPPPPPSSYLPAGIAAPTPLPPSSAMPGYTSYPPAHSLTPIAPTPLNGCGTSSLKRKAFYMMGQADVVEAYGDFTYSQPPSSSHSPLYRLAESGSANGNSGFERTAEAASLPYKPATQPPGNNDPQSDFGGAATPPAYSSASKTSRSVGDSYGNFESPITTAAVNGSPVTTASSSAEERLKGLDPRVLDLVSSQVLQQLPLLDWGDIAGLDMTKAALKEDVLWPMMRPDMFGSLTDQPQLLRTLLLFGPRGSGRTLLARCMASQMGATFLHLRFSTLVTKWLSEGEKILQATFLLARARQPCVLLLSELEVVLGVQDLHEEALIIQARRELIAQLDGLLASSEDGQVLVLGSSSRPQEMDEQVIRRYFSRRVLVPPPDGPARHQIISQNLLQHNYCLSEEEVGLLVQRTEGFSGMELSRLCQEALRAAVEAGSLELSLSSILPSQIPPVTYQDLDSILRRKQPSVLHKDMDAYTDWSKMLG